MPPLVSVVLPVYNGEEFLSQAVDSMLAQTFTDYELIVVDDGSTDRTAALLKGYQDSRLTVYRHDRNEGLVAALNTGWQQAGGTLIAIMNADDVSLPDRLAQQTAFLQAHPQIGLLGSAVERIDRSGAFQSFWPRATLPGVVRWELFFKSPFVHPTVMMRRSLLAEVGGYRQEARDAEDFDLWVRMVSVTQAANLPAALLRYRLWPGSISMQRRQSMETHSIAICRATMSRGLGRMLSLRETAMLRRLDSRATGELPVTVEDVRHVAALVFELQRRYVAESSLTALERQQIDASVARKLVALGRCAWSIDHGEAVRLFVAALRLLPEKPLLVPRAWRALQARRHSRNLKRPDGGA